MNERNLDQRLEKLEELKLGLREARGEHISMIGTAVTASAAVFASLPMALSQETPAWLTIVIATFGALGGTFAIKQTEATRAEIDEAKRKIEDYQARIDISRLRS